MQQHRLGIAIIASAVALALAASHASAQKKDAYPTKPIRMIVPFAPGGGTIGAETAVRSLPDG